MDNVPMEGILHKGRVVLGSFAKQQHWEEKHDVKAEESLGMPTGKAIACSRKDGQDANTIVGFILGKHGLAPLRNPIGQEQVLSLAVMPGANHQTLCGAGFILRDRHRDTQSLAKGRQTRDLAGYPIGGGSSIHTQTRENSVLLKEPS